MRPMLIFPVAKQQSSRSLANRNCTMVMSSFPSLVLLLFVGTSLLHSASPFALVGRRSAGIVIKSSRPAFLPPLFGVEEDLEGEVNEEGVDLAEEFYELERGKGLTAKDMADLENDDFDGEELVAREQIDEFGNKKVDIEFSDKEDYSDNISS